MNSTTTTTTTDRFYSIWRNRYIRDCIRCNVCRDNVINVTIEYINDNHRYLSLFTYNDKVEYNIIIQFQIINIDDVIKYTKSNHRELIDSIYIVPNFQIDNSDDSDEEDVETKQREQQLSKELMYSFHQGLRILSFPVVYQHPIGRNHKLPDSITDLHIDCGYLYDVNSPFVDMILSELPPQLKKLYLSRDLDINVPMCTIPDTLEVFEFATTSENFKHFVVPPNKRFQDCLLQVECGQDLEWVAQHTWVHRAKFASYYFDPTYVIPSHLTDIDIHARFDKLGRGVLPVSLTKLTIYEHKEPLEVGVLPPGLLDLELHYYDHQLEQGHLPDSLTKLIMRDYEKPLKPHVFGNRLKSLTLVSFNEEIQAQSLPHSLEYLDLPVFRGSFEHVGPLDNLNELKIPHLHTSVAILLQNVTKIDITTRGIPNKVFLKDTAIQDLYLLYKSLDRYNLYPGFFPSAVLNIEIRGLDIKMKGVIPDSCVSLNTDQTNLNTKLLPSSINIVKY
ncbi:hypothetical protein CYY_000212 [Polysphondylium violaceum]|uniref:FNIP repeat-containing protein n=1 Tax=Polysphondylium violaceum TaxID=133409 RepID=A0A8J4Q525_9MYCE|nr:hypothetical protein CYY_000212 [Polysphondylium violaceum]